jgi:hypothetical protein
MAGIAEDQTQLGVEYREPGIYPVDAGQHRDDAAAGDDR